MATDMTDLFDDAMAKATYEPDDAVADCLAQLASLVLPAIEEE